MMASLALQEYRSKVRGCWLGNNIGGTVGAPFEWQVNDIGLSYIPVDCRVVRAWEPDEAQIG